MGCRDPHLLFSLTGFAIIDMQTICTSVTEITFSNCRWIHAADAVNNYLHYFGTTPSLRISLATIGNANDFTND